MSVNEKQKKRARMNSRLINANAKLVMENRVFEAENKRLRKRADIAEAALDTILHLATVVWRDQDVREEIIETAREARKGKQP